MAVLLDNGSAYLSRLTLSPIVVALSPKPTKSQLQKVSGDEYASMGVRTPGIFELILLFSLIKILH
jgi:hypothetical protein